MDIVDLTVDDTTAEYRFYVPGNPIPMPRARKYRNIFVNVAKNQMKRFGLLVRQAVPSTANGVLFEATIPLSVTIWFLLRRPDNHFRGKQRLSDRLKLSARRSLYPAIKPDIDNLAKFVLDSIKGIAFADDSQVVHLVLYKMRDSDGDCEGGTLVHIAKFEDPVNSVLPNNYKG